MSDRRSEPEQLCLWPADACSIPGHQPLGQPEFRAVPGEPLTNEPSKLVAYAADWQPDSITIDGPGDPIANPLARPDGKPYGEPYAASNQYTDIGAVTDTAHQSAKRSAAPADQPESVGVAFYNPDDYPALGDAYGQPYRAQPACESFYTCAWHPLPGYPGEPLPCPVCGFFPRASVAPVGDDPRP